MRYTFYRMKCVSVETALRRMKELVGEIVGDPNPEFTAGEGDAGWAISHTSPLRAFTDKRIHLTVLVHFDGGSPTVEGFFYD
jgi:hypothetical protein